MGPAESAVPDTLPPMQSTEGPREDRRRLYREILRLWEAENPIKTLKLQFLLLTNGLLVPGFFAVEALLGPGRARVVALVALASDLVWVFSIGRTVGYQKLRKCQLERIRAEDPADPLLSIHAVQKEPLAWWGRVSASTYLIGAPLALAALWLGLLLWTFQPARL
jgi:hypothetical protein